MGWIGSMASGWVSGAARAAGGLAVHIANGFLAAANLIGTGLKTVFLGTLNGLKNMAVGAFSAVGHFILSLPGHLLQGVTSLFSTAAGAIGSVFQLLRSGVTALAGAASKLAAGAAKAVQAAADYGRTIADVRGATGLSNRAASGIVGRFGAFGIKGSDTASMLENQNPMMFNMKASMYGLPGLNSPNLLPALAANYQSMNDGGIGTMIGRRQLQSLGLDNAQVRRIAMTPVSEIVGQQNYQSNVQQGMGLNPELLERAGREFDMLTQRLKIFTDTAMQRLGQELLPKINAVLSVATDYLASNAGRVSQVITEAVSAVWKGFLELGRFLYADLPPMVLGAAEAFLQFVQSVVTALPTIWEGFITGISVVENGLGQLPALAQSVWSSIANGLAGILDGISGAITNLGDMVGQLGDKISAVIAGVLNNPTVQKILTALPALSAALPAVDAVENTIHKAGAAAGDATTKTAKWLGLDDSTSAALGLGAQHLVNTHALPMIQDLATSGIKWAGKRAWGYARGAITDALGGGADAAAAGADAVAGTVGADAAAAGAGALGADAAGVAGAGATVAGGVTAGTVAGVGLAGVAAGTAAGYGLYRLGQSVGLIDRDQGFGDRLATGWGRVRDLFTGNSGHYDEMVNKAWAADIRRKQAEEKARAAIPKAVTSYTSGLRADLYHGASTVEGWATSLRGGNSGGMLISNEPAATGAGPYGSGPYGSGPYGSGPAGSGWIGIGSGILGTLGIGRTGPGSGRADARRSAPAGASGFAGLMGNIVGMMSAATSGALSGAMNRARGTWHENQQNRGYYAQRLDDRFGGGIREFSNSAAAGLQKELDRIHKLQGQAGSAAERNRTWDRLEAHLSAIESNTKNGANAQADTLKAMGGFGKDIIARAIAYNAQDMALVNLRVR